MRIYLGVIVLSAVSYLYLVGNNPGFLSGIAELLK